MASSAALACAFGVGFLTIQSAGARASMMWKSHVSRMCNHRTVSSIWNVSLMQLSNVWTNVSQRSTFARSRRSLHAFFVKCMHTTSVPLPPNASGGNKGNNGRVVPTSRAPQSVLRRISSTSKKPRHTCWTNAWKSSSNSGTRLKRSFAKPFSATEQNSRYFSAARGSRVRMHVEDVQQAFNRSAACWDISGARSKAPKLRKLLHLGERFGGRPGQCMAQEVLHQLLLAVCMAFMIRHQSAGESAHFVEERGESFAGIACSRTSFLENASRALLQKSQGIQALDNHLNISKLHRVAELGLLPVLPGRRRHRDNRMLKSRRARTTTKIRT